ncbi:hypothetical protein CO540_13340 [Micromonospora sp. WMMA2032]|uniref:hypothetical protein n=1 Tax=Micromonospora sp. WMMA2032 TaxID=2039870 RepID=UPI000C05C818|nr:hypothetical protein [Micromonospora sp. WMMA2032]ATO14692.1 hypothetical protein CO540_13340 [Micromonospora sp. WMMA2032]
MARTVKVGLSVDEAPFVRGMKRAEAAAEGLEDALDDVSGSARDAAGATGRATEATDDLGDSAKDTGRDLDRLRADAARLDRQIDETSSSIRELARQIAATSDEAERVDLTKKLHIDQRTLRQQLNLRELLEVEADDAAVGFAGRFGARLGPLMASAPLGSGAGAAGAALAAAMAPTLGAGVAGAVIGGSAGLGIIGGAVLAARDARVQAAGKDLGAFILGDLEKRASAFAPVLLDAMDDVRAGWSDMGEDLSRIFGASRLADPLVAGMISGTKRIVAGIADAVDEADPVVNALGASFDRLGDAVGDTFSTLADDADEGASALNDLTVATSNLIRTVGGIVHLAAAVKGYADNVDVAIDRGRYWLEDWMSSGGVLEHFGIQLDLTADGFRAGTAEAEAYRAATTGVADAADFATLKAAGLTDAQIIAADASGTYRLQTESATDATHGLAAGFADGSQSVEEFTARLEDMNAALYEHVNQNLSAEQANIRLEEAIDNAAEAAKDGAKKGIDPNTEAGRRNRLALLGIADAAVGSAEAILEQTGSQELASQATERGRAAFLRSATAMGVSKKEAIELANKLFGIPKEVETKADFQPDNKGVSDWKATLSGIPREIFTSARLRAIVDVDVRREQATEATGRRWGGVVEHAQWGRLREAQIAAPVSPARYAWAEPATGGEAFVPRFGNRERSLGILSRAARWYGQQMVPAGGGAGGAGQQITNQFYWQPQQAVASMADFEGFQRRQDALTRVGRPR